MIRLTLMDNHSSGCHSLDLWVTEHGEIALCVHEKAGGAQFDFDLDDSDLEMLSIMIDRAKREKAGGEQ